MRFWDASALVPLVVREPRTRGMQKLAVRDPELVLWWGTPVECSGALCRLVRDAVMTERERRKAAALLDEVFAAAAEILPTADLRARAVRLLSVHPLRAADSLQLAAALAWCHESPAGAEFVCLDSRLSRAAAREGFTVLPEQSLDE
ncbi:MAG: type II toxin-antitoxin system VapC family toxin [Deltaproteobacteria bacterium]|nr:type II toxin-antitoxin system VapC family toxin [Deltaproteobacteria bacterium]